MEAKRSELLQIAKACGVGGALFCAIALLAAPGFWWLGLLAGFAGGYVAYEFRAFVTAVPTAARLAWRELSASTRRVFEGLVSYFRRPHPFVYPGLLACIVGGGAVFLSYSFVPLCVLIALFCGFWAGFVTTMALSVLAIIGAPTQSHACDILNNQRVSYADAAKWVWQGIKKSVVFLAWTWWTVCLRYAWRFARHLLVLVHSDNRLLCACNGTLGGAIGFFAFRHAAPQSLVIASGALFGAALGVIAKKAIAAFVAAHPGDKPAAE